MIRRRLLSQTAAAAIAGLCVGQGVWAQSGDTWPTKPVRLIVPGLPGGATDIYARALADRLSLVLKQPVIIDNRPGASGIIAAKAVMHAPADGYTLLYSTASSTVMAAALKPDLGIAFSKDLAPVAATFFGGVVLAVHPDVPAKNLKELVALIKAKPDQYSYASFGVGSNGHLTMEWLKSRTGMKIQHVAYKGVAPMLTEMTAGIVKIGWVDLVGSLPVIQTGKIRPIVANGTARTSQLPDLPTMGEQGHPFPGTGWQGVLAPKGTPQAVVQRLNTEINKLLLSPEITQLAIRFNAEPPKAYSVEQFSELLVRDLGVWKRIVADAHIQVD